MQHEKGNGSAEIAPFQAAASADLGHYMMAEDIENTPLSRTWLVQGMVEEDRIYQVFGKWKSGKSLAVMDMACHLALGRPWAGRQTVKSLVVWVAGESVDDMRARLQAFMLRHDARGPDMPFALRKCACPLTDLMAAAELDAEVRGWKDIFPDLPVLLVIDTLNRNFGSGQSENSDEGMGLFTSNLIDVVARPNRATVLVVHHTGHMENGRGRGHSSFPAAIDGSLRVEKTGTGPEYVCLEVIEARSTQGNGEACFRIAAQELPWFDNFGERMVAPVLIPSDSAPKDKPAKDSGLGRVQHQAMGLLRTLTEEHRANIAANGRDPDLAKVTVEDWRKRCSVNGVNTEKRAWHKLKKGLLDRELIRVDGTFVVTL